MNPPLNILAPGPWDSFAAYSGLHALTLAVCVVLIAAPSLLGRALSKTGELGLRRAFAALAVCYWLAYNIWWNWHGLDPRTGLPLQICDLNGLVAPLALLTGQRWARATLYFWTAALTLQAFIQPALTAGPASLVFWAFWMAHTIIAASAVYDIVVLGFRPSWRDLGRAVATSAVYVALVLPLDVWLGANYGFLGNPADPSEVPPFVAALGPWPQRAIIVVAMAPLGFAVVLLPWLIAARRRRSEENETILDLR
ncbi:MAG: TIGR02206 family membrane protein [Xanthobacteraceae bacterium]